MLQQHEKYTFPVSPGTMGGIFHLPLRKPIIESIHLYILPYYYTRNNE